VIFADTVYLLALLNPTDNWHRWVRQKNLILTQERVLTTAWVLLETANGLAQSPCRPAFYDFVAQLESAKNVEVVSATKQWFYRGLELYNNRPDKEWSLTDCISFEVMKEHKIMQALTEDHHFEQAGFNALMKREG
jgi:uncharacterized protein